LPETALAGNVLLPYITFRLCFSLSPCILNEDAEATIISTFSKFKILYNGNIDFKTIDSI
jgi:hypothetical protein